MEELFKVKWYFLSNMGQEYTKFFAGSQELKRWIEEAGLNTQIVSIEKYEPKTVSE